MKTRKITLLALALAMLTLTSTACNKTGSSANANVNSSPGKNNSSLPGKPSRFVGTWAEEGQKNDKGTRFTDDGKVIEVSSEKQVGTYTASGNDRATITIAEGGAGTATLESENRMRLQVGGETTFLIRK